MSVTNQQGFIFTEFSCRYYCSSLEDAVVIIEMYYPEHEDPRRQNIWIVNPFVWKGIYE